MLTRVTTCFLAAATLVLVMASSAHARLQPIRNYDLPVATGSGKEIQAEALRRVIIEAGRDYVRLAVAASEGGGPYAKIEDTMRPARARALWLATGSAGVILVVGFVALRRARR